MLGQTVSHYRILEKLGEGGMGVVYKAEDTKLLRPVALKFLPPDMTRDEDAKKRFMQEARAASALDHPNIAVVHEINETAEGHSFICMAYYEGQTLRARLSKGPMGVDEAARVVLQIASGLQRAHESKIVHRDIKPGNIIITPQGDVKIVDFGLAKLAAQTKVTMTRSTGGTAAYMSPEQIMGHEADARSDLFSLGIVFYEAVTGRRPFLGEHEPALFYSIANAEPVPPTVVRADIPKEIERIILRLLQKNPENRYQSAADLREDLRLFLGESLTPRPISQLRRILRRKYSVPILVGATVLITTLILLASGILQQWLGKQTLPSHRSIAVLPFRIIGGDSIRTSQCDGLYEIIASKLVQFQSHREGFWVIATSDSRTYKNGTEAYQKAGATIALNCSFQFSPGLVKVTVNLEDTKTSRIIGSDIINDESGNLRELESRIVRAIAGLMGVEVTAADIRGFALGTTKDDKANDLYVEARGDLQKYANSAKLAAAIAKFRRAVVLDPQFALAYAGLGEAYWRKYETTKDRRWIDSAEAACTRALQLNDKLRPVHFTLGIIFRGSGRDSAAVVEFGRVLAIDSLDAGAYRELADVYLRAGKPALAEETFKRAIALRPKDWTAYNALGRFYNGRGRYDNAIQMWNKVVELAPDIRSGYTNLGAAYFSLERWQDAIDKFKRSIEVDSNNYPAYFNLGNAFYYDGMYDRAAQSYEKARALNSTDYRVWGGLGAAYHELGSKKLAQEAYETAAKMAEESRKVDPRDTRPLCQLAGYYADLGRKTECLSLVREVLALAPNEAYVLGRVGITYELLGDRQQALSSLGRAVKLGFSTTEIKYSPQMKSLREDPQYVQLTKRGETRQEKK